MRRQGTELRKTRTLSPEPRSSRIDQRDRLEQRDRTAEQVALPVGGGQLSWTGRRGGESFLVQ